MPDYIVHCSLDDSRIKMTVTKNPSKDDAHFLLYPIAPTYVLRFAKDSHSFKQRIRSLSEDKDCKSKIQNLTIEIDETIGKILPANLSPDQLTEELANGAKRILTFYVDKQSYEKNSKKPRPQTLVNNLFKEAFKSEKRFKGDFERLYTEAKKQLTDAQFKLVSDQIYAELVKRVSDNERLKVLLMELSEYLDSSGNISESSLELYGHTLDNIYESHGIHIDVATVARWKHDNPRIVWREALVTAVIVTGLALTALSLGGALPFVLPVVSQVFALLAPSFPGFLGQFLGYVAGAVAGSLMTAIAAWVTDELVGMLMKPSPLVVVKQSKPQFTSETRSQMESSQSSTSAMVANSYSQISSQTKINQLESAFNAPKTIAPETFLVLSSDARLENLTDYDALCADEAKKIKEMARTNTDLKADLSALVFGQPRNAETIKNGIQEIYNKHNIHLNLTMLPLLRNADNTQQKKQKPK